MKIRDQVIAITGAASGIGQALAVEMTQRGARVAISDVNEEGLAETSQRCRAAGSEPHVATVEVSDRERMYAWADEVVAHFGHVNGIVNNAGVSLRATVEDMDYEDFEWLIGINFWGVVYGTKAFLPHIRAAGVGCVVNVSSVFGIIAVPTQSAYNASKFAVRGFTEALRLEMDIEGLPITVTSVHPGGIKTNIVENGRIRDMSRFEDTVDVRAEFRDNLARTTSEEAARTIIKGIEGDKHRVLVGLDAHLIDRGQRSAPVGYQKLVAKMSARQMRIRS